MELSLFYRVFWVFAVQEREEAVKHRTELQSRDFVGRSIAGHERRLSGHSAKETPGPGKKLARLAVLDAGLSQPVLSRVEDAGEPGYQFAGPVRVHAWSFDKNKIGRTEEIDADSQKNNLDKVAEQHVGGEDESPSEFERDGDDEHVHQIEGVAHASGERDPLGAEDLTRNRSAEGCKVGKEDEWRQEKRNLFAGDGEDGDPDDDADEIPPATDLRLGAGGANVGQQKTNHEELQLAGQVPGGLAVRGGLKDDAGEDERNHDTATNDCGRNHVEAAKQRREYIELHLHFEAPGYEVDRNEGEKVVQIDDVSEQRQDQ